MKDKKVYYKRISIQNILNLLV